MRNRTLLTVLVLVTTLLALAPPSGADGNEAPGAPAAARSISAGLEHTCVVFADGDLTCWGLGDDGRLGQGSTETLGDEPGEMAALVPVDLGAGRTATAVTASGFHTCALLDDGSVRCWGLGSFGRLGQDSTATIGDDAGEVAALEPVDLGEGRTATVISAGGAHTCAVLDNGSVKCWGFGGDGRLGQGSTENLGDAPGEMASLPAVDLGRPATAVSAGANHTCALLDDGTVKCWGENVQDQLGQGPSGSLGDAPGEMAALAPVDLGVGRTATAVSAGVATTCALLDDGTVKCWGFNADGRLGQGNTDNVGQDGEVAALTPVVLGAGRTATAIATSTGSDGAACALLDDASVKCWGAQSSGQLGQGSTDTIGDEPGEMAALAPVDLGVGRTATAVTAGDHVCALLDDATVKCWGRGDEGRLGQDSTESLGDGPGEMAALQPVDLSAAVGVGAQVRPDAHLRQGAGPFVGLNRYNTTGANQTRATSVAGGGTATFTVRLENDGSYTNRFRVRAQAGTNRYTVTYRRNGADITPQVRGAGFRTPELRPGSTLSLTVTVQARAAAVRGSRIDRVITVTSEADSTRIDAVKVTVTRR